MTPRSSQVFLLLYASRVQAGFPSPADAYIEKTMDLNEHLIDKPASAFFFRGAGDSMIAAGIHHNDIVIVDRSLMPKNNNIVIAVLEGELTIKRLKIKGGNTTLTSEGQTYREIMLTEKIKFSVWGVVTSVIHQLV